MKKKVMFLLILSFILTLFSCKDNSYSDTIMNKVYGRSEKPTLIYYAPMAGLTSSFHYTNEDNYREILLRFSDIEVTKSEGSYFTKAKYSIHICYGDYDTNYEIGFAQDFLYLTYRFSDIYYIASITSDYFSDTKKYFDDIFTSINSDLV